MIYCPFWGSRYSTILFKYVSQTFKTLRLLFREKPAVVFVMTPPVIACLAVWLYAKCSGASYVIDAHTATFVDPPWSSLIFLQRFCSSRAVATLVTNEHLASIVRSWECQVRIMPDVPVYFAEPTSVSLKGQFNMTLVCSFTKDEPIDLFLNAASKSPDIQFYVTGDMKDADPALVHRKPSNVEFTGYLPDSQYVGLLMASDAVLSLTTVDHTMQRGAYEAVYLGKPVITSNFGVLRECFDKGTVHVNNTVNDMVRGMRRMRENISRYREEVCQLRTQKLAHWQVIEAEIRRLLQRDGNDV
jgi:glycosyltransferase involved in cell wall biosynthesis